MPCSFICWFCFVFYFTVFGDYNFHQSKMNKIHFNELINDISKNYQPPNLCWKCRRVYRHKSHLTRHLRYECGVEPKFSCQYCPYKSKLKHNLKSHVLFKHFKKNKC